MRARSALMAGAFLAAAACTSGGGGGDGDIVVRAEDLGGSISVGVSDAFVFGTGVFYTGVASGDPNATVTIELGTDVCEPSGASTGTAGEITFDYADVGDTVTFASGAISIVATRNTTDGITYIEIDTPGDANARSWTVTNSGSASHPAGTIATVQVPSGPVVTAGGTITSPGQPLDVTWTGAEGANGLFLTVYDFDDIPVYECLPKNDGSFTLPPDVTTAAGSGGYIEATAASYGTASFGGKTVLTLGVAY